MSIVVGTKNGKIRVLTGDSPDQHMEELTRDQARGLIRGLEESIATSAAHAEGAADEPTPATRSKVLVASGFVFQIDVTPDGRGFLTIMANDMPTIKLPLSASQADALSKEARIAARKIDQVTRRPN